MTAKPARAFRFTGDHALGAAGLCLAGASAAFGIGMTVHGPVASFGTGGNFTVFAQLAPHGSGPRASRDGSADTTRAARPDDLDMTATASIPRDEGAGGPAAIIPAVTLEALGENSATVSVGGRTRLVHVGDEIPGAGQIVAILPGVRPALRTSQGLIVPAAE